MTPTTTPAPMTHEERLAALALASVFLERNGREALAGLMQDIRTYIEAERTRADALAVEVEALRGLAACAYQMAGVHDAPVEWLDALSDAASGLPFDTENLLPYMPDAVCKAEARIAELEAGIGRLADNLEWLRTTGNPSLKGWAKAREDEARSLIGHKEG